LCSCRLPTNSLIAAGESVVAAAYRLVWRDDGLHVAAPHLVAQAILEDTRLSGARLLEQGECARGNRRSDTSPALPRYHSNYRGYAPSDVPADPVAYSQEILIADVRALMTALEIEQVHVIGIAWTDDVVSVLPNAPIAVAMPVTTASRPRSNQSACALITAIRPGKPRCPGRSAPRRARQSPATADRREHHQHGLHASRAKRIERDAQRQLGGRIGREQAGCQHTQLACGQAELRGKHGTDDRHHRARGLVHDVCLGQRKRHPDQHPGDHAGFQASLDSTPSRKRCMLSIVPCRGCAPP
jgi:pimeloyl-ACP methyl ester carboxylesterase